MTDNIVLIIPSLNPDEKLKSTVNGMLGAGFKKIIVVNDGSDKKHIENFPEQNQYITVLTQPVNCGKGAALKLAFDYIYKNLPDTDAVITVDGDGQHTPEDTLKCAKAIIGGDKNTAVLGCRNFSLEGIPARSRIGNKITSGIFKLLCGIKISDTQTGLRAFPYSILPLLCEIKGERFEYETNMLLKFKQKGINISEVSIETVYIEDNATSHFRPIIDSIKIYRFIFAYFISSFISFLTDISLFYIICKIFEGVLGKWTVLTATVIARAISSIINYSINRSKVFDAKEGHKKSLLRYYALAIPIMLASAGTVSLLSVLLSTTPIIKTVIKIIVDTILFIISYRLQQTWVFSEKKKTDKRITKKLTAKKIIGRTFLSVITAILMAVITVVCACMMICYGPSESLRNMTVIMAKEASATKWIPDLFLPKDTIDQIIADSEKLDTQTFNPDLLITSNDDEWVDGTQLIFLSKPKFKAYVLLVRDPSRISVGVSSDNFKNAKQGSVIFDITEKYNCLAAINGGEFADIGGVGTGATPMGLTYSGGKNVWNDGLRRTFIGFDKNNKLVCAEKITKAQADALNIRDGVAFKTGNVLIEQVGDEVKAYKANRNIGTAQRTAIGQKADGTVIMIVTDGRAMDSIGATRNDIIDIMLSYGAVTAGMLDGGSSAMMYYENYADTFKIDTSEFDEYQSKGLVNRYKAFSEPRYIPTYFIVSEEK